MEEEKAAAAQSTSSAQRVQQAGDLQAPDPAMLQVRSFQEQMQQQITAATEQAAAQQRQHAEQMALLQSQLEEQFPHDGWTCN